MTRREGFRLLLLWALLCAVNVLSGCSAVQPPLGPTSIEPIDRGKLAAVQSALKQDGELAGEVIRVAVHNNTVTLEGAVQTADEKQRAEKIASGVKGVDKVDNRLTVRPSTP